MEFLSNPDLNVWVITPLLIFIARICDVSIGTIRIISLSRGHRLLAPALGFFEILLWLLAIRQIFQHLDSPMAFIAYAGGFATGNLVGLWIEDKMALGLVAVRLITQEDATVMVRDLNEHDFGVTSFAAEGVSGSVRLLFMIAKRRDLDRLMRIVKEHHPHSFITISDVRSASEGVFPETSRFRIGGRRFPGFLRKSK